MAYRRIGRIFGVRPIDGDDEDAIAARREPSRHDLVVTKFSAIVCLITEAARPGSRNTVSGIVTGLQGADIAVDYLA
jgi:hypothetical protein